MYDTLTKNVMQPSGASGEASLSNAQRVAAGCMSGMSACVVVFPLETLRTHAAMGNVKLKGAVAYFRMAAAITRCASYGICRLEGGAPAALQRPSDTRLLWHHTDSCLRP